MNQLLPELPRTFVEMFSKNNSAPEYVIEAASNMFAGYALYGSDHPLEKWLREFIRTVCSELRETWARAVEQSLPSLTKEQIQTKWRLWIEPYWSERLTGKPNPFSPGEQRIMLDWCLALEPVLDAAISKLTSSDVPLEDYDLVFFQLTESPLVARHPELIGQLIQHLLRNLRDVSFAVAELDTLLHLLHGHYVSNTTLRNICERMATLGCPPSATVMDFLHEV